jgi:VanZ family protein
MDYAALILWMLLMFTLSGEHFSSAHTAPFTTRLVLKLFPWLTVLGLETIDLVIRKIAHLSEYFVFAILLRRVLRNRSGLQTKRQIVWAIALGVIYAMTDELHQSFVPSRNASPLDVMINTVGFVCGTLAFQSYIAIRRGQAAHRNSPHSIKPDKIEAEKTDCKGAAKRG